MSEGYILPVPGYEGHYAVGDDGTVYSLKKNKMVPLSSVSATMKDCYYPNVSLCMNGEQRCVNVHRLVAEAFVPNPDNKPEVDHIDRNKQNNNVTNLRWVTRKENVANSYRENSYQKNSGKLKEVVAEMENGSIIISRSQRSIAKIFGVNQATVHHWLHGRSKGYRKLGCSRIYSVKVQDAPDIRSNPERVNEV